MAVSKSIGADSQMEINLPPIKFISSKNSNENTNQFDDNLLVQDDSTKNSEAEKLTRTTISENDSTSSEISPGNTPSHPVKD